MWDICLPRINTPLIAFVGVYWKENEVWRAVLFTQWPKHIEYKVTRITGAQRTRGVCDLGNSKFFSIRKKGGKTYLVTYVFLQPISNHEYLTYFDLNWSSCVTPKIFLLTHFWPISDFSYSVISDFNWGGLFR